MIVREHVHDFAIWIACCDTCGDRHEIEMGSDDIDDAVQEARAQGLKVEHDKAKFNNGERTGYTEHYHIVTCGDCQ